MLCMRSQTKAPKVMKCQCPSAIVFCCALILSMPTIPCAQKKCVASEGIRAFARSVWDKVTRLAGESDPTSSESSLMPDSSPRISLL